jgi:hypothetical protein
MTDRCQRGRDRPRVEDVIEPDGRDVFGDSQAGLAQRFDCTQARQVVAGDEGRERGAAGQDSLHGRLSGVVVVLPIGDEPGVQATRNPFHGLSESSQPRCTVTAMKLRAGHEGDSTVTVADKVANRLANPVRIVRDDPRSRSLVGGEDHRHTRCLKIRDIARLFGRHVVGKDDQAIRVPGSYGHEVGARREYGPCRAALLGLVPRADADAQQQVAATVSGSGADPLHQFVTVAVDCGAPVDGPRRQQADGRELLALHRPGQPLW